MKAAKVTEKSSKKFTSALSEILNFVSTFIVTCAVILAIAFSVMKAAGIQAFSIKSASMYPKYPVNSVIFVKPADASLLKKGDVITYVLNESGVLVTYRIISVNTKNKTFITKGDANDIQDPSPVLWDNVVGKAVFDIPYLGGVVDFVTDKKTERR